jgi:RNA polymerase sigma-54 factor
MKQSLSLTTKQSLKMTPQLQQAIKLLHLSAAELENEVKSALETNPMLESVESSDPDDLPVEIKWDNVIPNLESSSLSGGGYEFDKYHASPISLREHLEWQLNLMPFSKRDQIIGLTIIDAIDDDGYLHVPLDEIKIALHNNDPYEFKDLDDAEIEAVLHCLQQFDPIGVASRNLKECMLLQLNALPATTPYLNVCQTIVQEFLDLLGNKDYASLKQKLTITEHDLQAVLQILRRLHPYPAELITAPQPEYIIPDVIVSKSNQTWRVELHQDLSNKICINSNYASLIKKIDNSKDNQFLRGQLTEAKWLLNSLKNRNTTLLNVARYIVAQQQLFLEHGEEYMQPLKLGDVAQAIGLNESTVSRITTKKYLLTPRGIYELKFFFSNGLKRSATGNACSSTAIKAIIKKLICNENAACPLSDQDISDIMQQQGITISRRTVAKYRENMGLQASNQRKK